MTGNLPNNQSSNVSKDCKDSIKRRKESESVCMRESIIRTIMVMRMMERIVQTIVMMKIMIKMMITTGNSTSRKCSWKTIMINKPIIGHRSSP